MLSYSNLLPTLQFLISWMAHDNSNQNKKFFKILCALSSQSINPLTLIKMSL